jgi:hypothetical protein
VLLLERILVSFHLIYQFPSESLRELVAALDLAATLAHLSTCPVISSSSAAPVLAEVQSLLLP